MLEKTVGIERKDQTITKKRKRDFGKIETTN